MSNPLRIGFIGGGFITRFHIQSLCQVRDCVVAGVADMSKDAAESALVVQDNREHVTV